VFVLVIWPAFGIIIYLGLGVSETATGFFVAHPTLYMTACQIAGRPIFVYMVVCFVLSLIVAARNYRRLPDPDSRRRIKWVIAGVKTAVVWSRPSHAARAWKQAAVEDARHCGTRIIHGPSTRFWICLSAMVFTSGR
jgi:hypothetical protein